MDTTSLPLLFNNLSISAVVAMTAARDNHAHDNHQDTPPVLPLARGPASGFNSSSADAPWSPYTARFLPYTILAATSLVFNVVSMLALGRLVLVRRPSHVGVVNLLANVINGNTIQL